MSLFGDQPAQTEPDPDLRPWWWCSVGAAYCVLQADGENAATQAAHRALHRAGMRIDHPGRIEIRPATTVEVQRWHQLLADTEAARRARIDGGRR